MSIKWQNMNLGKILLLWNFGVDIYTSLLEVLETLKIFFPATIKVSAKV